MVIKNPTGLHCRPAGEFMKLAQKFQSYITVRKINSTTESNAKSMLSMMAGGFSCGTEIIIRASGADEMDAVEALAQFTRDLTE